MTPTIRSSHNCNYSFWNGLTAMSKIKYSHKYMFQPYRVTTRLTFRTYYKKYTHTALWKSDITSYKCIYNSVFL